MTTITYEIYLYTIEMNYSCMCVYVTVTQQKQHIIAGFLLEQYI